MPEHDWHRRAWTHKTRTLNLVDFEPTSKYTVSESVIANGARALALGPTALLSLYGCTHVDNRRFREANVLTEGHHRRGLQWKPWFVLPFLSQIKSSTIIHLEDNQAVSGWPFWPARTQVEWHSSTFLQGLQDNCKKQLQPHKLVLLHQRFAGLFQQNHKRPTRKPKRASTDQHVKVAVNFYKQGFSFM